MECQSIQEKLSAYRENLLSSEEKAGIDEHLKNCSGCSEYLEDLKKTVAYVQGLEEVEAPPWLTQKVMSRVREEAVPEKGIIEKLFFPLHVKVPVQVIATIAIAVTAFYVVKTIQLETKLTETLSEQDVVSEEEVKTGALENDESYYGDFFYEAFEPATGQWLEKEAELFAGVGKPEVQRTPAVYRSTFTETPVPEKRERFNLGTDMLAGKGVTEKAPAALARRKIIPYESYSTIGEKMRKSSAGYAFEREYAFFKDMKEVTRLTLYVKDPEKGVRDTEKIITGLGGKVVKAESFNDKDVLIAEINPEKLEELTKNLERIGGIEKKETLYTRKAELTQFRGKMKIRIEIMKISFQLQ